MQWIQQVRPALSSSAVDPRDRLDDIPGPNQGTGNYLLYEWSLRRRVRRPIVRVLGQEVLLQRGVLIANLTVAAKPIAKCKMLAPDR